MKLPREVQRVIDTAQAWAPFQEADSLRDQMTDVRLKLAAIEAREALIAAVEELREEI